MSASRSRYLGLEREKDAAMVNALNATSNALNVTVGILAVFVGGRLGTGGAGGAQPA